jgi:hypothetical protein
MRSSQDEKLGPPGKINTSLIAHQASGFWAALVVLLMYTGPYRLQITTSVVIKYLAIAAYSTAGALAFFTTLFLCARRSGRAS